jgi:hypothetical protein
MRNKLRGLVGKRGAPLERADARLRFAHVIDFSIETQGCYEHWFRRNAAISSCRRRCRRRPVTTHALLRELQHVRSGHP